MPRTPGEEAQRSRILLREFRKRRQPKRCDSLPCLRLAPANRQLYVCHRCSFFNAICAICPWCLATCNVDAQVAVSVVRRRLSSPMLLSDAQKMQLANIERGTTARPISLVPVPTPLSSCALLARGGGALPHLAGETSSTAPRRPTPTRDLPVGVSQSVAQAGDILRRGHRNAALISTTTVVATTTEDTTSQPFLDQFTAARLEGRFIPAPEPLITTPTLSVRISRDPRSQSPRSSRSQTLGVPSSLRPRVPMPLSTRDVVVPHTSERPPSETSPPSSPISRSSTTPSLRRKRRMATLRQRSSCSLRRRTNSSAGSCCRETATCTSSPSSPRPRTATTATSPPGSPRPKTAKSIRFSAASPGPALVPEEIPLGHPQRPLYTAIRKNMSRPESPAPSATSASFDLHVYERGTRSLDLDAPPRYGSLTRASQFAIAYATARPALFASATAGGGGGGFSVSGETEMRMDLARSRSMDGVPGDFAFQEKRKRHDASMKAKVKSLGKTLKGLLRGKS